MSRCRYSDVVIAGNTTQTGIITFTTANTYTGDTTIDGGRLRGTVQSLDDAMFLNGGTSEIIFNQNVGATTLDLSGLNFSGIQFRFPDLTTLTPGERFLIASGVDPAAFAARMAHNSATIPAPLSEMPGSSSARPFLSSSSGVDAGKTVSRCAPITTGLRPMPSYAAITFPIESVTGRSPRLSNSAAK